MKTNSFQKKLASYSAVASAIFAIQNSDAQIIYTDVSPDSIIMNEGSYNLDLNNDGVFDAFIELVKWKSGYIPSAPQIYAGNSNSFFSIPVTPFYTGSTSFNNYVRRFDAGELVDSLLTFENAYSQRFVKCYQGNVYGEWSNVSDGFMAIRFTTEGSVHFGWLRLGFSECGSIVTVKDYAYQATPGKGIKTGESIDAVNEVSIFNNISVQSSDDQLKIVTTGIKLPATFKIFNSDGQVMIKAEIKNEISFIPISRFPSGLYIVSIESKGKIYSAKFIH
jgi:hypothetical protein